MTTHPAQPPTLPDHLGRDCYWQAAWVLLSEFSGDHRVWDHVHLDHAELGDAIDYQAILTEGTWSSGERRLLEAAASMWQGHRVDLVDLANMGDRYWRAFMIGLDVLREGFRGDPPPPLDRHLLPRALAAEEYELVYWRGADGQYGPGPHDHWDAPEIAIPRRLWRRIEDAEEDREAAEAAVDAWLRRHGIEPPTRWEREGRKGGPA